MAQTRLRYGNGHLTLDLPDGATVLTGPKIPALPEPEAAVREALAAPIGCAPLRDLLKQRRDTLGRDIASVCITLSDITRPVPNALLITALLEVLNAAGIGDDAVTLVIATGMHRESTPAERDTMLGADLQRRCRVIDHTAHDASTVTRVSDDPPVSVNTIYHDADFKIVTGLIEPHFMAGFSGGRKGVCPGLVDLETVSRFHGYHTMADPNSVEGRLRDNPCHDIAHHFAHRVGVDFLLNVAITHDREPAGIYAGDLDGAFLAGCRDVAAWTSAELTRTYDLVVTSAGGYPLDKNFYQTIKGMCTAMPALSDTSTLLMISACDEIGEPAFSDLYDRFGPDWRAFLAHIRGTAGPADEPAPGATAKDQWEYQMQTRVLDRIGTDRLILANDGLDTDTQRRIATTPLHVEGTPENAPVQQRVQAYLDRYAAAHPDASIAVIPEGPYVMLAEAVLA